MRMSCDPSDDGFRAWLSVRPARVLLDGVERTHVVMADEERREIVRYRTDEAGRFIINAERTAVERETLRGAVTIVSDRPAASDPGAKPEGPPNVMEPLRFFFGA